MMVEHIVVIVEEPSARALLEVLLPSLLGGTSTQVIQVPFKGKPMTRLVERLRGYAHWVPPSWRIVVLVDRDDDECHELKARLEEASRTAGLVTRSMAPQGQWIVANRVVAEELEAWFLGDVPALQAAFPGVPASLERQAKFRDPDAVTGGTWEALEKVLQRAGHFRGGLRKVDAARAIAPHMEPDRNRSRSFQVFRDTLRELAATGAS
jgi:hypothetical protein